MAVHDEARAPVDEDLLDPADRIERASERVLLRLGVDPPVGRIGEELVGGLFAGPSDPVAPRRGRGRRGGLGGHGRDHRATPAPCGARGRAWAAAGTDISGETRPRAHDWEARTSRRTEPACGYPRSALRAFTRRAPLAEFLERHSTRVLAGSNGAPPSMSARTWSSVRSRVGCAGCSGPSPGHTEPCWPTWRAIIRLDRRVHRASAWT